ncbi:MAG: hypothetical protein ACMUIE_05225 [Thermoplasmatota archaeon]
MPADDKEKKKRQKEAAKVYEKSMKAFSQGKLSKEELKDRLRPYKYELKDLGYPVTIKDDDRPREEDKAPDQGEAVLIKEPVTYAPWRKRSQMTIEEIESRVDSLSLSRTPSDSLRKLYHEKYGEDLAPPEELVPFEQIREDLPQRRISGELPAAEEGDLVVKGNEPKGKGPFWKSMFKRSSSKEGGA